jgi:hypothetical protein
VGHQIHIAAHWLRHREPCAEGQVIQAFAGKFTVFVAWLTEKLETHGVGKVVPESQVLDQVRRLIEGTASSWDEAVEQIVSRSRTNGSAS